MQTDPIREWHFVVCGYLQSRGQPNGCVQLWRRLQQARAAPDRICEIQPWDVDVETAAEFVWRLRPAAVQPRICVYGYSWGGMSAVLLCRALARRGLDVEHLCLCDPVYRHPYMLGQWRCYVPLIWPAAFPIRVPRNVEHVWTWRQERGWPRAHRVVAADEALTELHGPYLIDCEHRYMDDRPEWMDQSLHLACALAA